MVKIKICGMKRLQDIKYVNELKPDYVGFIFAESKRQVTLEQAKELINLLDKKIKTVGVFVNEEVINVKSIANHLKLNIIQLHGDEDESYLMKLKDFKIWKTVHVDSNGIDDKKLNQINNLNIDGILLDTNVKGKRGGTGKSFSLELVKDIQLSKPVILAGGLKVQNVQGSIEKINPYAVDVSSGVEVNGVKNFNKMEQFIRKVRKEK